MRRDREKLKRQKTVDDPRVLEMSKGMEQSVNAHAEKVRDDLWTTEVARQASYNYVSESTELGGRVLRFKKQLTTEEALHGLGKAVQRAHKIRRNKESTQEHVAESREKVCAYLRGLNDAERRDKHKGHAVAEKLAVEEFWKLNVSERTVITKAVQHFATLDRRHDAGEAKIRTFNYARASDGNKQDLIALAIYTRMFDMEQLGDRKLFHEDAGVEMEVDAERKGYAKARDDFYLMAIQLATTKLQADSPIYVAAQRAAIVFQMATTIDRDRLLFGEPEKELLERQDAATGNVRIGKNKLQNVDPEAPTVSTSIRPTPGGAKDYPVPTRYSKEQDSGVWRKQPSLPAFYPVPTAIASSRLPPGEEDN